MKILKWMQKKLNWSSEKKKPNSFSTTYESPVSQLHALLEIGTFGNSNLKENLGGTNTTAGDSFSQDCMLKNLQNEFNIYFQELVESTKQKVVKGKENCSDGLDNKKSVIGMKVFVFLLKKMFVCRSGFQPIPSFKDPFSVESRIEKILRAMLHKKLPAQGLSLKIDIVMEKYPKQIDNDQQELSTDAHDGRKWDTWDRTNSQYIVLEI